jgi:hypothetical protein
MRYNIFLYCWLPIVFCVSMISGYPAGWSDDILLTPEDSIVRSDPDVTVDLFHDVWAVWDSAMWVNGTGEALFSKRDSLGACLIPETSVSNNASYSLGPLVAVDASNNLQFVWVNDTPLGWGLWHARLANDGSIIIPSHLAVGGNNGGYPIRMVMNRYNEVNVAWNDNVSGYDQISYTKLDSSGNPIIARMRVSPVNFYSYWPGIGVDSMANIHMAYRVDDTVTSDHLLYTKLDRYGNVLVNNKPLDRGASPAIVADKSQNIHIVYSHPVPYVGWDIDYLKLDQNANILVGPKVLSSFEHNAEPRIAIDSLQYLHVVWCGELDLGYIIYTKLDTLGNFVIPPMSVVYSPYSIYPYMPRIAVDLNNRLHLVWMDQRLDPGVTADIFYKRGENETKIEEQLIQGTRKTSWVSTIPNPFTRQLKIDWHSLTDSEIKEVDIYDIMGKEVKNFRIEPNNKSLIWSGDDNTGQHLPGGVYFIAIFSNGERNITKVVKLE